MPNIVDITVRDVFKSAGGFAAAKKDVKGIGDAAENADNELDEMGDSAQKSAKEISSAANKAEKEVSGLGAKLGSAGKAAGAAGGAAMGAGLAVGFAKSLEFDTANAKLKAQLGGSAEFAGDMGKLAGDLYSNAYGGSLGEVSDALAAVVQSGALMEDATNEQIKSITGQAMSMAGAFGIEVPQAMQAVSRMVKTGMVPDAQAGLNLIAVAFQQLGPGAEDVLDTFTEYSSQFQKIGIDGPTALGLVNQMMDAGARSTDLAADAIKEFSIRSIDGSKLTADSFKGLGLDATNMASKFTAGGQTASDAFQLTIDKLKAMPPSVERNAIAVGLFGTQAEDLGQSLMAMDTSTAAKGLGDFAKAAQDVDKAMGGDAQSKITSMQRSMEGMLAGFVNAPGIIGGAGTVIAAFGSTALSMGSQMALLAVAMPEGFKKTALSAVENFGKMILAGAGYVASSIAGAVAAAAAWAIANAAMILATGGIILAIAAVIAIVVLVIKHWDWVKEKTKAVWDAVWGFIKSACGVIKDVVMGVIHFVENLFFNWTILGLVIKHWDAIKNAVKSAVEAVINFVKNMISRIAGAFMDAVRRMADIGYDIIMGIWHGIERGWNWLVDRVKNLASTLFNAAKSALGISSPSKLFMIVGHNVGLGLAKGVEGTETLVGDAARRLAASTNISGYGAYSANVGAARSQALTAVNSAMAPVVLQFKTGGTPIEEFLAQIIRNYVKVQGGDVQQTFGRA